MNIMKLGDEKKEQEIGSIINSNLNQEKKKKTCPKL